MQYLGSKARLSKELVPIIQKYIDYNNIETYVEPFVGGANVIDKIKCKTRIGSDINKYLIALLEKCKNESFDLPEFVNKEMYDEIRYNFKNKTNKYDDWFYGIVGFGASFGGKFFGGFAKNKKGTNYILQAKNNLIKQSIKLVDINFKVCDYKYYSNIKNAVIYCDPPYRNTTKYSNGIDYEEFYQWCRDMSKNNIVLISEYEMPADFTCIWEKELSTNFDSNRTAKQTRIERLYKCNLS